MVVYQVECEGTDAGYAYVTSKRDAVEIARREGHTTITALTLGRPTRALLLACLNREGFAQAQEEIAVTGVEAVTLCDACGAYHRPSATCMRRTR